MLTNRSSVDRQRPEAADATIARPMEFVTRGAYLRTYELAERRRIGAGATPRRIGYRRSVAEIRKMHDRQRADNCRPWMRQGMFRYFLISAVTECFQFAAGFIPLIRFGNSRVY